MKLVFFLLISLIALPGLCQEEDDKLLQDLEADRKKQMEAAVKADQATQQVVNQTYNMAEELQKVGYNTIDAAALLDDKVVAILQRAMAESQIYSESHEALKAMIMGKAKGGAMEKVFTKFPKTLDIAAGIMGDREAMPSLLGILKRKEELKRYGITAIGFLIIGAFMRKALIKKHWGFFKRTFYGLALSLSMSCITLGFFYYLFKKEVSPTIGVISKYL